MVSTANELNKEIPGKIYLCQVNATVSCGACCGLYNVEDASRDALRSLLLVRSEKLAQVPRNLEAILAFKAEIEANENGTRPYPKFHHCPYIGLAGDKLSRVGCLLHPLADGNQGVDFSRPKLLRRHGMPCVFLSHLSKAFKYDQKNHPGRCFGLASLWPGYYGNVNADGIFR